MYIKLTTANCERMTANHGIAMSQKGKRISISCSQTLKFTSAQVRSPASDRITYPKHIHTLSTQYHTNPKRGTTQCYMSPGNIMTSNAKYTT